MCVHTLCVQKVSLSAQQQGELGREVCDECELIRDGVLISIHLQAASGFHYTHTELSITVAHVAVFSTFLLCSATYV